MRLPHVHEGTDMSATIISPKRSFALLATAPIDQAAD